MKKIVTGCLAVAAVWIGLLNGQPPLGFGKGAPKAAKGPEPCERECLEGFVTQYLDALVAHNPFGGLPLARKVRFTENAQELELGDGLWNVSTGIGKYKLIAVDPQSQQVGFLGTVFANDRPTTLALRLKIENRKITEIETLVNVPNQASGSGATPGAAKGAGPGGPGAAKGGLGGGAPTGPAPATLLDAMGAPDAAFTKAVPEGERKTRDQLIAATNAYYDAIEKGNAGLVEFDPDCNRIENGIQMTNNPEPAAGPGRGQGSNTVDPRAMSCVQQIASKVLSNYHVIYPRRTPVVDEERQIVFGFFMYQQPGDVLEAVVPGHGSYKFSDAASQPGFVQAAQMFQFNAGRIRRMEALTQALPYGTPDPYFNDSWRRSK